MNSAPGERRQLMALMAALENPALAAELPSDDPALAALARHHRLTPLLSITCAGTLPTPLAEAFRRDRIVTAARNMLLAQVGEECIQALAAGGVRTIVLKGLDYETRLYRTVGVRPTADVDILVPNEKRRAAFEVLDRLGFEPRAAAPGFDDPDYHEVAWTRAGVEVDLHMALAPFARCSIDYPSVWREAEPFRMGQADAWVLAPTHAAIFQALHMAIDHFDVPAIYLVDLTKLIGRQEDQDLVEREAGVWRCRRPLLTAMALAREFLPVWAEQQAGRPAPWFAANVVTNYGTTKRLRRSDQLVRKLIHFDRGVDAVRYVITQARRNVRELVEKHLRKRSARERLTMDA